MTSLFDIYQSQYQYTNDEFTLFESLISIPPKITFSKNNYTNTIIANNIVLYVSKTNEFLSKYNKENQESNKQELEEIVGKEIKTEDNLISAADFLKQKGAENVLVSLGEDGALLVADDGMVYKKAAFKVNAVNTVGSGDSMIAGFLAGLDKGYEYALKLGAAAGAATAALSGLATREKIEEIINIL
jgi:fructose-1-phosphate kinase PfkB-like protein